MRCKNCGWPNKPQTKTCVKCHAPLDAKEETAGDYAQSAPYDSAPEPDLNKTVRESDVFDGGYGGNPYASSRRVDYSSFADDPSDVEEPAASVCPKCGYPLRPDSDKCPNCKFSVHSHRTGRDEAYGEPEPSAGGAPNPHRRPTRMDTAGGSGKMRGTVNPYMMNMELDPTFALQPLKRMNERKEFEEQEYEGKEVILNRDNTEIGNASITSREQALITRVDGRWYIEDKSDQKTTFVQAAARIELHDGDIILLGNRLFKFHE